MKQRLDYVDRAKGILIILVVIGHVWQAGYVHNFIYNFHMPAFFAISGMLLHYTQSYKKSFLKFAWSRIYSFGIPFLFIEFLGCMTDIARNGVTMNIKGYMYNTLTLNFNDSNLWFLFTLFWIEILFAIFKKLLKKDMLVLIAGITMFLAYLFLPEAWFRFRYSRGICFYSVFFTAGFCFTGFFSRQRKIPTAVFWIAIAVVAAIFGKRTSPGLSLENAVLLLSAFMGICAVLQTGKCRLPEKLDKWLICAGKNTITIYGTHHFYYAVVGVLLGVTDYAATPIWAGLIMLTAVTILEIPTIYIINRWLPFLAGKHYKKKVKV